MIFWRKNSDLNKFYFKILSASFLGKGLFREIIARYVVFQGSILFYLIYIF